MQTYLPQYSCVHVAAIDVSMTELGYGECVNRGGIHADEIGMAVLKAIADLPEGSEVGQVTVRFSTDT